jgi:hypothetical protein
MGTRSNLYKNPSLAYKKDFGLSSVLQNLRGIYYYFSNQTDLFNESNQFLLSSIFQLTTLPLEMLLSPKKNNNMKNNNLTVKRKSRAKNDAVIPNHRLIGTLKSKRTMDLCLTRITLQKEGK